MFHVYRDLFLGQVTLRSTRIARATVLRQPPRLCPASVKYYVDHTHRLILTQDLIRDDGALSQYATSTGYSFKTTTDLNHLHTVALTFADISALRGGRAVLKQTSRNARPGGSLHVHDVVISCVPQDLRNFFTY